MYTKKTNNTNKLIQISYHFVLTKIQKLQNLKKKKKTFFCTGRYARYRPVLPEIGRYDRYEAGTAGIFSGTKQGGRVYRIAGRYGTVLTSMVYIPIYWFEGINLWGVVALWVSSLPMKSWMDLALFSRVNRGKLILGYIS